MDANLKNAIFMAWTLLLIGGVFDIVTGITDRHWAKPASGAIEIYVAWRLIKASRKDEEE